MYKIACVVAVIAFAVQGAVGRYAINPGEISPSNAADPVPAAKNGPAVENKPDDPVIVPSTSTTSQPLETTTQKSGASGSEICVLLVQVSSLAWVAKHALL